ncbi:MULTISPECIES: MBL fold metallo-hydrolase [Niastella]|uniref:MBL fold metallo-hydrolase n=1 Tax=Niastella soli TaxID=2821487 RepID=A0ABS3Z2K9_9BACT|nr:MBL fold metallo-hydrolase [Niastella soli]MBO9204394.1 MBL fold metallo-hydrolase [Niastella soli]
MPVALLTITGIVFLILLFAYLLSQRPALPISYLPMDASKNYCTPAGWKGTPVDRKGRFLNHEYPFYQNYLKILQWLPSHLFNLIRNRNISFDAIIHSNNEFLYQPNTLIWLGHASFYLNLNGVKVLIDPHFYNTSIYKRHTPPPITPELFTGINLILISHDHADHCDKKSLRLLLQKNPAAMVLSGSGMEKLLRSCSKNPVKIITAEWYQQYPLSGLPEIYFVPSRHYCKRIFERFNGKLWGGFVIKYTTGNEDDRTLYFGGDSGYGNHFKDIQALFKPDVAILGIGAYEPLWFMHPNHMSPRYAVKAFDATGAVSMIPMHYGTFNLSNENMHCPIAALQQEAGNRHIIALLAGEILPLAKTS